jgi:hypothetical protein
LLKDSTSYAGLKKRAITGSLGSPVLVTVAATGDFRAGRADFGPVLIGRSYELYIAIAGERCHRAGHHRLGVTQQHPQTTLQLIGVTGA